MKVFQKMILERVSTALEAATPEAREEKFRELFRPKISAKAVWLARICQTGEFTEDRVFQKWLRHSLEKHGTRLFNEHAWFSHLPKMATSFQPNLPQLDTPGDLASHLHLNVSELRWFADLQEINPASGPLQHYRYRWIPKRRGNPRLLMEPKEGLKIIQRRILETILYRIPVHHAAHGFTPGRSIRTFAEPHIGRGTVLHMDLGDFFPSITFPRALGYFQMLGYPTLVAKLLAGLCTHAAPSEITRNLRLRERHLPQGAPTSPALANLIAYRLDARLSGLAKKAEFQYTRYADDLAFSGSKITEAFSHLVGSIIMEERFFINPRKTRFMRNSARQHLAGVVVNSHPNIIRGDFDRLKAILHNCRLHGPVSQNVDRQHLRGKIAALQMLNPARGEKLLRIFDEIEW